MCEHRINTENCPVSICNTKAFDMPTSILFWKHMRKNHFEDWCSKNCCVIGSFLAVKEAYEKDIDFVDRIGCTSWCCFGPHVKIHHWCDNVIVSLPTSFIDEYTIFFEGDFDDEHWELNKERLI